MSDQAPIGHNSDIENIVADINAELSEDVASILRKGSKFAEAKQQLGHGQFARLFATHAEPLPLPVKCTPRYAQILMSVAANELLSNAKYTSYLPPIVDLLYALSRFDTASLKLAFDKNLIHPHMTRKDLKAVRVEVGIDDEPAPKGIEDAASGFIATARAKALKIIQALPTDERDAFAHSFAALASDLKAEVHA
jgi:hypothetical protein